MAHDHHHSHGTDEVSDTVLLWSVIINFGLSIFEFVAGAISGSVALMADALHNTNDAAALLIAYIARKIARRGADATYTFGYRRAELIGAMIQLTALILIGIYLVYEAVKRLFNPEPLSGEWIMVAAGAALIVDMVTAWLLWAMSRGSLNVKAAFLHNLTDAAASMAVLAGGAAVYWLDWRWVDPVITLLIAGYILQMSLAMLGRTARILMDRAPPGLDLHELAESLRQLEGVSDVHHLHVRELDEHHRAMEAHVRTNLPPEEQASLRTRIKQRAGKRYEIHHSTIEIEDDTTEDPCPEKELFPPH